MQQSNGLQQQADSQTAAPGPGSAAAAAAATGVNIVPPKKKLDAAVIYHDIFNLASILALVVLNLNFMANGNAFWVLWWATMGYFVVDIVWVVLVPHSVKGVEAIMLHHVVTTVLVFVPLYYPEYQHLMGINMTVEINTWLLIAKRHYKSMVLEVLFYATWIVMRLILYPYLVIAYYFLYMSRVPELGYVCFLAVAPIIQFVLTSMNFWWTGTMVRQLLAKRKSEPSKTD